MEQLSNKSFIEVLYSIEFAINPIDSQLSKYIYVSQTVPPYCPLAEVNAWVQATHNGPKITE